MSKSRKSRKNNFSSFLVLAVSVLGLATGLVVVRQKQFFGNQAKMGNKHTIEIPLHSKKIGPNEYDLGEVTDTKGRKVHGYMIVEGDPEVKDVKKEVLGAKAGRVLQSSTYNCVPLIDHDGDGQYFAIQDGATNYYFDSQNSSGLSTTQVGNAIDNAGTPWEAAANTPLFENNIYADMNIDPTKATLPNGRNDIYFSNLTFVDPNDPHKISKASRALALTVTYVASGRITEVDIVVNDLYQYTVTGEQNKYDLQFVIMHELGHAAGLADQYNFLCDGETIMYADYDQKDVKTTIDDQDKAAIYDLYNRLPIDSNDALVTQTAPFVESFSDERYFPIADTYVHAGNPNTNYGNSQYLQIDGDPKKISYLKFDLRTLAGRQLGSAILRMYVYDRSAGTQVIKNVTNSWSEGTLTYNNRPAAGTTITSFGNSAAATWKEVDLKSFVNSHVGQIVSIMIDSASTDGVDIYSRNATSLYRPYILIHE